MPALQLAQASFGSVESVMLDAPDSELLCETSGVSESLPWSRVQSSGEQDQETFLGASASGSIAWSGGGCLASSSVSLSQHRILEFTPHSSVSSEGASLSGQHRALPFSPPADSCSGDESDLDSMPQLEAGNSESSEVNSLVSSETDRDEVVGGAGPLGAGQPQAFSAVTVILCGTYGPVGAILRARTVEAKFGSSRWYCCPAIFFRVLWRFR